jgi:hypothetical protein
MSESHRESVIVNQPIHFSSNPDNSLFDVFMKSIIKMIVLFVPIFGKATNELIKPFFNFLIGYTNNENEQDTLDRIQLTLLDFNKSLNDSEFLSKLDITAEYFEETVSTLLEIMGEPLFEIIKTYAAEAGAIGGTSAWAVFQGFLDSNPLTAEAWNLFETFSIFGMKFTLIFLQSGIFAIDEYQNILDAFHELEELWKKFSLDMQVPNLKPPSIENLSNTNIQSVYNKDPLDNPELQMRITKNKGGKKKYKKRGKKIKSKKILRRIKTSIKRFTS